jgi:sugar phosphate isomerase/epimerase
LLAARNRRCLPWSCRRSEDGLIPSRADVENLGGRRGPPALGEDLDLRTAGAARGFDPAADLAQLDNAIDEAKALNAPSLVLVVGSLPGALAGNTLSKDIARARARVYDGVAATLDYARGHAMPLAIEPLHPNEGAERSCINTLSHALEVCDALDPACTGALGVALDVYHTWWDPQLETQIKRAGRERLFVYHMCAWLVPTRDLLNDRGMMGVAVGTSKM